MKDPPGSETPPSVCRYFAANGQCHHNDRCNFSHNLPGREHGAMNMQGSSASHAPLHSPPGNMPKNQRLCRNVATYGFCKFAGKGCEFSHEHPQHPQHSPHPQQQRPHEGPGMVMMGAGGHPQRRTMQGGLVGAQGGVGRGVQGGVLAEGRSVHHQQAQQQLGMAGHMMAGRGGAPPGKQHNPGVFYPGGAQGGPGSGFHPFNEPPDERHAQALAEQFQHQLQFNASPYTPNDPSMQHALSTGLPHPSQMSGDIQTPSGSNFFPGKAQAQPQAHPHHHVHQHQPQQGRRQPVMSAPPPAGRGGFMYSQPQQQQGVASLHQQVFSTGAPVHTSRMAQMGKGPSVVPRSMQTFFVNEGLRQDLMKRKAFALAELNPDDPDAPQLPKTVNQVYHTLFPLEAAPEMASDFFGPYRSMTYKAINSAMSGAVYAIRQIEDISNTNDLALNALEMWRMVDHPCIATLREAFISKDFGDPSLCFVYDYHPGLETMENKFFLQAAESIPEDVLWSYLTQLCSAVRAIHNAGLACRVVHSSKVLISAQNRLRLSFVGIADVLKLDATKSAADLQHQDLVAIGHLILSLACKSQDAAQNLPVSLEFVGTSYSIELKNALGALLTERINIFDFLMIPAVSAHFFVELDNLHRYADDLESELSHELENGRLFRLQAKLGFINERQEYNMDPTWSETGDRYLLKLFRDYVFHQVDENTRPIIDFGHVVDCLNKLDVGSYEKMLLVNRDEQSLLMVSYKDLQRCVSKTFDELLNPPQLAPAHDDSHGHGAPSYNPNNPGLGGQM